LKKSFSNNFHKNAKDAVWTEENLDYKLEDQVKTLENRLQASQSENSKLLDTLKDQEETIDALKSRCAKMEDNARVEKKKSKKERQKNAKKEFDEQNSQDLNVNQWMMKILM
jgi:predicted RNase H-like nuclease (RuvC/YqgF family)